MTIQYEKMIVLLFNQLFMFRLQTAKILYDLLQEAKRFLLFFFIGDYHIQSMRNRCLYLPSPDRRHNALPLLWCGVSLSFWHAWF